MSEQQTKDPVTLDALKRAIEAVGRRPFTDGDFFTTSRLCSWENRRADAWRTAFEWREGLIHRHMTIFHADALKAWISERDEGISLIREKLQS